MLNVSELNVAYGHVQVLNNVNIEVNEGEIVTIIGSNGAGKSTLLKAVSGVLKPVSGSVMFGGKAMDRLSAERVVAMGISHVPEGRQLFSTMSVLENLELGAYLRFRNRKEPKSAIREDMTFVFNMFPVLQERARQAAGTLSGGEQQMLAIGRALMSKPKLLLLDEPSMGLAPIIIQNIFATLKELRKQGLTIVLVEQDVAVALSIADRGYVLQNGAIVMHDTGENLLSNEDIKAIYFGHRKHAH